MLSQRTHLFILSILGTILLAGAWMTYWSNQEPRGVLGLLEDHRPQEPYNPQSIFLVPLELRVENAELVALLDDLDAYEREEPIPDEVMEWAEMAGWSICSPTITHPCPGFILHGALPRDPDAAFTRKLVAISSEAGWLLEWTFDGDRYWGRGVDVNGDVVFSEN